MKFSYIVNIIYQIQHCSFYDNRIFLFKTFNALQRDILNLILNIFINFVVHAPLLDWEPFAPERIKIVILLFR